MSSGQQVSRLPVSMVGVVYLVVCAFALCLAGPTPADAETQGEAIVVAAASQAGRPYCWDGGDINGPTHGSGGAGCEGSTVGFDCTGLTLFAVYQATGRILSHDGRQATEGGQIIAHQSELQPGDLVFFGGTLSSFTHAGVYAGNGQMWDAADFKIPVQLHSLGWVEHALPFVGGARYWSGNVGGSWPPSEGSFVSHDGYVYRIAGGAPVYVSNWAAVGGPQPSQPLTDGQFASLQQYPRDGTILDASSGGVFIAAGGAPLYLSNWNVIGGPQPGVGIDTAAIDNAGDGVPWDHLRAYPADGTILDASGGGVFIAAGGAPLYLSNWNVIGGPQPGVRIDEWDVDNAGNPAAHLRQYPADGTLIATKQDGRVYRIAGGAPLYVSTWNAVGGPQPSVGVDQWDVDNSSNPAAHLRKYPADGTLIATTQDGRVYRVAGGAPLYVSDWNAVGGPQSTVAVDQWDVDNASDPHAHLREYPADGTFLGTSIGRAYRVAGGAPFLVSDWSIFGGVQPSVNIDQWDIDHTADPHAHILTTPVDGTLVEGLPSDGFWSFTAGLRASALANDAATSVDDVGLAAYRVSGGKSAGLSPGNQGSSSLHSAAGGPHCSVPNVMHMALREAKRVLRRAHCRLGKVRRAKHSHHQSISRVTSQSAAAHSRHRAGYPVGVTVN